MSFPDNTHTGGYCRWLIAAILVCGMASTRAAESAVNQAAQIDHYQIAPQALGSAINAFIAISDWQVGYPAELVRGRQSPGVSGDYPPVDALKILLQDSDLNIIQRGPKLLTLERKPQNDKILNQADPVSMPAVKVVGKAVNDVHDPYFKGYTIPNATAGTKTDTPIMETPLNVQVVSKQVLKDQQVISLDQALKNVSGVTAGTSSGNFGFGGSYQAITLRGFASNTFFRNGFRLQEGAAQRQMANIESVEVLKGSAAILYGQVEPGGMVNVTTKQPLATPYYALQQQFGSYDLYRTTIDATGPLTDDDTLLYRMNMSYENSGSFREFVDNENVFLAPVLKWNISPDTRATLELEYTHYNRGIDTQFVPLYNGQFVKIPRSRNYSEPSKSKSDTIFVGLNWSHRFNDDWSIKHSFSFNQQSIVSDLISPFSPISSPIPNQVPRIAWDWTWFDDTYSTNLDLTGHFNTFGLKHTLLFGGDYYRVDHTRNNEPYTFDYSLIDIKNPIHPGTPFPPLVNPIRAGTFPTTTDQYGFYLQDQIELPYRFFFTGGFRYQYIHKTAFRQSAGSPPRTRAPLTADAITPRVGLLWRPQDWLSVYANYVESFGDNANVQTYPGKIAPPSAAQQWEVGAKTELFDGRLRASLSYYDLTKQNVATADPDPAHIGFSILAGEVRSRGYEVDIQGEILPGWNVIATYSNTDIRITKSNDSFPSEGDRFYLVPRNTANLWSTYDFQQNALQGLKIGGGVTMRDSQLIPFSNTSIPGYATVDLLAAYSLKVGQSKITAQVNVNNLLDKYYYSSGAISAFSVAPGYDGAYVDFGQPRSVMGSIKIEF